MITVTFADGCLLATASKSLWQYDYGQQLEIVGLDLPEVFQVDFCNSGDTSTITVLGENNVVSIPDQFILDGRGITAFCFVYDETTGGTTRAEMKLPVLPRPERTEEQPDPEQEHVIDQLISELGENVEDAEAWAVGERDGVPVSEGDPTYNNSAKYWAGKAMTDAPVTSVNGKAGDIVLNLDDIPNGEQYARTTPAQIQQIGTNAADIADVEELIPAEASAGNQLADKYFVNNEIQTNSAHFRGAWPNWFSVPTDKNQYPADNKGIKTPSANDYIVVLDASGYPAGQTILSGTWRFSYVGSWEMSGRNGWKNEYQVNETALHTEQIAAINAKIPSQASASNQLADKNLVNTKLMAYRTAADQDAIDSAQDGKINALTNLLNNKQSKITANGILKGNGNGGISAAVAGMDYLPTSALYAYRSANAQDAIDNAQDQNINKNTAAINTMQPAATAADIGKALIVKTVANGKPTSYEYGEAGGGGGSTLTAGDGIDITEDVISNTQGIEYIVGTQTAATAKWTGVSTDETLKVGKIIAYYLPYAGASTAATLALTMADGTTTREISLQLKPNATVTTQFPAGSIIILVYDGTYWRVNASYDTDTNTYPTGYCVTNGSVAAKAAACSFGYRGDTNYFPCLFRFANTATDATLAITTYAPEAAPIYVNGARTSAANTFGAGVILFLYYNGAYYCYNDGRFPILVDGTVTSVQEYAAGLLVNYRTAAAQDTIDAGKQSKITASGILKGDGSGGVSSAVAGTDYATPQQVNDKYTKPSSGIPSTDMTAAVQASLQKADTALQAVPDTYRTAADQDTIDSEQDERIDGLEQTTTATTIGPVALATFDASAANMPLKGLTVDLEPVQDLNGYDHPWSAGGGKNKIPLTLTKLKARNTSGTWDENTYTLNGITFTVSANGDAVTAITVDGTNSTTDWISFYIPVTGLINGESYVMNGTPAGGSGSKYRETLLTYGYDYGNSYSFTKKEEGNNQISIDIAKGYTAQNIVFHPMIRLATETDATFEPYSNICPITGWTGCNVTRTGKNLFNIPSGTLKVGTIDKDTGVIDTSASTSRYTENMLKIKGGANYAFQCVFSGSPQAALYMAYYDSNGAFLERVVLIRAVQAVAGAWSGVVQMRDDASYIRLCGYVGVFNYTSNRQIEEGNEVTDYEPYQGNTYNITFPTEAGTVYGGTLDVVSGKLSVEYESRTLPNADSIRDSTVAGTRKWVRYSLPRNASTNDDTVNVIGEKLKGINRSSTEYRAAWTMQTYFGNSNVYLSVFVPADYTLEQIDAAIAGSQIVYKLTTPIVYDLTDIPEITTLLGENNIWADTGDVTATYGAYLETVKAYAEKVGDSILSAIAPLEIDYTASRRYEVGEFLFVGTKFYKVTATIADGGTITPGTNVTQTTVAEQLMSLTLDITGQPTDIAAAVGDSIEFAVTVSGGRSPYSYQWYYRNPGTTGYIWKASSNKTSIYSMTVTNKQTKGYCVYCVVTDANGATVTSHIAQVIVPT